MGHKHKTTEAQRFWAKVEKTEDCWMWTGSKFKSGGGQFRSAEGSIKTAAQYSWVLHYGPIPEGQRIRMTCGNSACVRPDHLTTGAEGRFWMKVDKNGPVHPSFGQCWIWTGAVKTRAGQVTYGSFVDDDGRSTMPHRFSYELRYGSAPPELDHRCRNKLCVRPEHLREATRKQNMENQGATIRSKSGVRGVFKRRGKWFVQVRHNGQMYSISGIATLEEAEQAAIELRNSLYTHNDDDRARRTAG
jgi:hypothetical protein